MSSKHSRKAGIMFLLEKMYSSSFSSLFLEEHFEMEIIISIG